jgi:hypothetical protein
MRAPGYQGGASRTFVPRSRKNHELEQPVQIRIKQPTRAQLRLIALRHQKVAEPGQELEALEMQREVLADWIEGVENYPMPNGEPITDGKSLWDHGHDDIVFETAGDIHGGQPFSDEEKKLSTEP